MQKLLSTLWNDESGQDLIEYALIAVIIAIGAVVAMTNLGGEINNTFTDAQDCLANPNGTNC